MESSYNPAKKPAKKAVKKVSQKALEEPSLNDGEGVSKSSKGEFLDSVKISSLPSNFIPYKDLDQGEITYRPYLFGEIKKMSMGEPTIQDLLEIVADGIETPFDINHLTLNDLFYIGLLRKISSLGTDRIEISFNSPKGVEGSKVISMEDIEFADLKAPDLPVVMNFGEKFGEFHFKPLTYGAFLKSGAGNRDDMDVVSLIALMCVNMSYEEAYEKLSNIPGGYQDYIEEVYSYLDHGVKPLKVETHSEKEGKEEFEISLEGGDVLMRPFRKSEESPDNVIRFGVQGSG